MRLLLLLLVITLLNRPNLTLTQGRVEPSVLAILVDDSISMRLPDAPSLFDSKATAPSRLKAVSDLLNASSLPADLASVHQLRFYRFDSDATPLAGASDAPTTRPVDHYAVPLGEVAKLEPIGTQSRLIDSIRTVAADLQGQRLAGVLVLTDGRQTDARAGESLSSVKDLGVKVFSVPIGSDTPPRNVELETLNVLDTVFVNDIVNFKALLRGTGLQAGQSITLRLKDAAGAPMLENGKPVERTVEWEGKPQQTVDLSYIPDSVGTRDVVVAIDPVGQEIDEGDNARAVQLAVLDANIRVLYVDGYPRWEYRYLRQELIRDKSIECSLLLTSADTNFFQEGDRPIKRFPETLEELMYYDVVLFGDVDQRQFTDNQLQLVNEFVSRRGGGFGMVAGPMFAPISYKGTAIEPLLPVDDTRVEPDTLGGRGGTIAEGWRPVITEEGRDNSIFRFYRDPEVNDKFLKEHLQPLFWYCRNVTAKSGVGQVLAQHPRDTGPDGRPAPIVVVGRFGTGRTLFSAIDDSWRWRYYTGEQVFSSYWVQTLRYLARGKKLGERDLTISSEKPVYALGDTVRVSVRVLNPQKVTQLPDELNVKVLDDAGQVLREVPLLRRAGSGDLYTGSFPAERTGHVSLLLPSVGSGVADVRSPLDIIVPKLELNDPRLDKVTLDTLARETGGASVEYAKAVSQLPGLIPSAERSIPVISDQALWDAPLALAAFVCLITIEWVLRKLQGLV
ncbi:MAG: hypothetical protein QM770_13840 [Tepidisphaeraceae bacterium]